MRTLGSKLLAVVVSGGRRRRKKATARNVFDAKEMVNVEEACRARCRFRSGVDTSEALSGSARCHDKYGRFAMVSGFAARMRVSVSWPRNVHDIVLGSRNTQATRASRQRGAASRRPAAKKTTDSTYLQTSAALGMNRDACSSREKHEKEKKTYTTSLTAPDSSIQEMDNSALFCRRPELIAAKSARPTFSWYRNDVEIFSNTSRYVTSRGDLVVLDDGLPMDGSYRVTAWLDALGEAASGVYFVATDNTDRTENPFSIIYGPADLELLDDEGPEMAEFNCLPSYSSDFNIHWYIDGGEATEEHRRINLEQHMRRLIISRKAALLKGKQQAT
ncbi:unnamed protein product, partial [Mesorhabditis spiculigera]